QHSEYNHSQNNVTEFLQIWVFPNKRNVQPRYDQITLNENDRQNKFQQILSPNHDDEGVWIIHNELLHIVQFALVDSSGCQIKGKGNGVYVFIISGSATVEGQELDRRDGMGIWDINELKVTSNAPQTEILLMEVPMNL